MAWEDWSVSSAAFPKSFSPLRVLLLAALTLAVLAVAPSPASARDADDAVVVITGDVDVARGETIEDVVVVDGDIDVAGRVKGSVVAFAGDVRLSGSVGDDVVTFAGRLRALPGAVVGDNVNYADERPLISPQATVRGEVQEEDWDDLGSLAGIGVISALAFWLAVTISTMVLGLLMLVAAPQAADATAAAFRGSAGLAIAVGLGLFIVLPLVAIIAIATLVGLPLGIAILFALIPLWALGYVAACWLLGERVVGPPRHRFVSFFAGWGILRGLALIPVLGWLVGIAATVVGLGALGVAIGRARREEDDRPTPAAVAT
jgi:hypothetical protein